MVPIPTLLVVLIPAGYVVHCDALIPVRVEPSPLNLVAVIMPVVLILAVVEKPRAVVAVVAVPVMEMP